MILALLLLAVPADARIALSLKAQHHIEKIDPLYDAVETDGPVHAEILPSQNELLLEPSGAGIAHVFLFARRDVRVLEVAIDTPWPAQIAAPTGAVKDAATYEAWRAHLAVAPAQEKLILEGEGVQAIAKAAQARLATAGLAHIELGISAFGVRLKNAKSSAEKRRALMTIWPAILGPLRLDE